MQVQGLWSNNLPLFCPRLIAVKCISKGRKGKEREGKKEERKERESNRAMAMGACNMKRGVQYENVQ